MPGTAEDVTAYLHEHIPLTRAIGARVEAFDESVLRIAAPLTPNLNHQQTAFGGSISALAVLSAWTLVHTRLRRAGCRFKLVVQESTTHFIRPIEADFHAVCPSPKPEEWDRFYDTLTRHGRARLELRSEVLVGDLVHAIQDGVFVAFVEDGPDAR